MKKITVKHYINNRLKSKPLYVRVIYDRKDTTFPSEIISNEPPTEVQLHTDVKLKREMEYEVEIITSIIRFCIEFQKEKFTFSSINFSYLIHKWKDTVYNRYSSYYIDNKESIKEIREPLLKFISIHTKIKLDTVHLIIKDYLEEIDALFDLVTNHDIYNTDMKNTIIFWSFLQEYENTYYGEPSVRWIYGADNMFGYYEWREKNGKKQFQKYVLNQKILPEEFVKERVIDFDRKLDQSIESALFYSDFTDTKRNPKQ